MGKKKHRVKKPTATPPPPDSTIVESGSKQATLAINSSDPEINNEGLRALSAFQSGDSKKALEMIKESISSHQDSPHLHCLEAFMQHSLAEKAGKGTDTQLEHLTNAASAVGRFPNLVELSFLHAALLYKLAEINDKEWDIVIEACERMLKIGDPYDTLLGSNLVDMFTGSLLEKEKVGMSNRESKIESMKQQIMKYLQDSRSHKNRKLTAMKADGEEVEDDVIKEDLMGVEMRKKQVEEIIKDLEQQKTYYSTEKYEQNVEKVEKYVSFWSSELNSDKKRGFLKVNKEELKKYVKSLKNDFVEKIFSEALSFAEEHKTWKFSECFVCVEKIGNPQLCEKHFRSSHWNHLETMVQPLMPVDFRSEWIEMIVKGVWKPVDTDKGIEIIVNKMNSDSNGTANSRLHTTEKGLEVCKDYVQGTNGDEYYQNWPLCDDSERVEILESIHSLFLLLLRGLARGRRVVGWAMHYAIYMLETIAPVLQFKCHSLKIPEVICFLGASQLRELNFFVHDLTRTCGLNDYSDIIRNLIDNHYTGLNVKERVVFNRDLTCLLLDERLLVGEFTNANYFDVDADDDSVVTCCLDMCKDDVHRDGNKIVSWLYSNPAVGKHLRSWTRLRDSKRGQGKEVLRIILEEFLHLTTAQSRLSKLRGRMEALWAIQTICIQEIKNREQRPERAPQPYIELLRKRKNYIQGNGDIASKTESDMIPHVLKEAVLALSSDHQCGLDKCELEDALKHTDNCVLLALQKLKIEMLKKIDASKVSYSLFRGPTTKTQARTIKKQMAFVDATIFRHIEVLQMYIPVLEKLCLYDYRSIIVPLLKSFLQTQLEDLFDKDTTKKYEAFLAELKRERKNNINKGCDNVKKKRDNLKKKKNKKIFRKAEELKANGGEKHFQNPENEEELDNNPNSKVGKVVDELIEIEEKKLKEHVENQKHFEYEASLRARKRGAGFTNEAASVPVLSDNPNSKVGENADEMSATEEKQLEAHPEYQSQFEPGATLGVNEFGFGFTNEAADVCSSVLSDNPIYRDGENADDLKELEREIEAYLEYWRQFENEATDSFVNMIIKSLWHLREFREEFMRRRQTIHNHIGDPCIVCALYDMFAALSIACEDNRGEVPSAPPLRVALTTYSYDKNICKQAKMNDSSELLQAILESLHESFDTVNCDFQSQDEYEGSLDCSSAGCFVHIIFGMDHYEKVNCVKCSAKFGYRKNTTLFLTLNAYNLRNMKKTQRGSSFDVLLKQLVLNGLLKCGACGQINYIHRTLWRLPHVFTIVIGWQRDCQSSEDVSSTLSALSAELDISKLFEGYPPDNIYFLASMVCVSSDRERYIIFVYNHMLEKYVQSDGATDEVTGSWADVVSTCNSMHSRPKILFYMHKSSIYFGII